MKDISQTNFHICAYCGKEYKSDKPFSHIIPRQFFRRFKQGINNKDAYSTYYERLTQREPREYLLCHECEKVFCDWENKFATNITNKFYKESLPSSLEIDVDVKLGALSVLWRILYCWVVSNKTKQGTLIDSDVAFLSKYEKGWLEILKHKKDFTRDEANIFLIPVDCIDGNNQALQNYKKYPGIMSNVVFYDQGGGKGYFCIRCLAHKVLIFAYLTPAITLPKDFSIHNRNIQIKKSFMPPAIECVFDDYAKDATTIKI